MIRVLQVLGTISLGGAESRVMDLYRKIDKNKIQFDFLVTDGTGDHYKSEIENMGGRVYYLPAFRIVNYSTYRKACIDFFSSHSSLDESGKRISEYSAVHGHMTSTASIYLPIAAGYGVPLTIAHARSAGVDPGLKGMATNILRRSLYKKCDMMIACSDEAGDAVFGPKSDYVFMPNAIDVKEYAYNETSRSNIRNQYGISDDEILIGHVGSFRYAKNHDLIIDIFKKISETDNGDKYRLMLVGDGSLRTEIEGKVSNLGLSDRVIFTGNQSPVAPYYSAFDILLFPSHYEGMPGTVVEAQASGLPCIISDAITKQVIITDLVRVMSLKDSVDNWVEAIKTMLSKYSDRNVDEELESTMYDVNMQVDYYSELYTNRGIL